MELQPSRAALLLAALLAIAPRAAQAGKAPRGARASPALRAEDDPALAGDAPAFARARVLFSAPADGAEVPAGDVLVRLEVQGYALGPAPGAALRDPTPPRDPSRAAASSDPADAASPAPADGAASDSTNAASSNPDAASPDSTDASVPDSTQASPRAPAPERAPSREANTPAPFALLLVDNDGALRIDDAAPALRLRGLAPGPHLLRLVLSRPWGEVVKASGAFALTRFWVGPRPSDATEAKEQEAKSWPSLKRGLLTYVFPLGELRRDLELRLDASDAPLRTAPLPQTRALDVFLSGAQLRDEGRQGKIRVVVNKRELPTLRAWRPLPLPLRPGKNRITIDLLDRRSTKVKNAVNRTDRVVLVE